MDIMRTLLEKNGFSRKSRLLFLLFILAGAAFLYRDSVLSVFAAVIDRQDSSHGVFVPFISGYFLWTASSRLHRIRPEPALLPASAMLTVSVLLLLLGKFFGFQLIFLSFLFLAAALVMLFFGKKMLMETSFPLFFLAAMVPLPEPLYYRIAEGMRAVNTWGSVNVARIFGAPVYQEGYDVYLPGLHLVVNYSCSGVRYLLSFFTFSIVYVFLFRESKWARLFIILGSIPFSFIAGTTRLSVVFLSAHYISPFWAEYEPHVFLSWVVFAVFLFGSIGLDQFLLNRRAVKRDV